MISFANIMRQVLTERMSFRDLFRNSDPARIHRGKHDVRAKSIRVASKDNGDEAWTFNYKSNPSTTGNRWHGYVRFFKEDVSHKDNAEDLDCQVDCDCPDYRYRWAYANTKQDASVIGADSLNKCINSPPNVTNPEQIPGMCKHLISLAEFLKTQIEPSAPEPGEQPEPKQKAVQKKQSVTSTSSTITKAPEPGDSYSDSRGGIQETKSRLFEQITRFVRSNPEFEVEYYD